MRFPPSLLDEIRARLPVSQVVGRRVNLKRAGRELKGLSPFKTEKTPSFTVNDRKGFYHCFASGEHGDIFTFLMRTEGLSFPEAVERLAQEAGVPVPKAGPRDVEAEDQRTRLYELLAASAAFFEKQLAGPQGAEARRYLTRRGLDAEGIARFRLGYAPGSKSALKEHLALAGFTAAEMAASGMLIAGDDIPVSYDRFRHRIMFPISDMKGRAIAFGGRALDPEAPAKYLNSPETPLFHKGAVLYNAHNARVPAHDKGQILVVEGYMDAIALSLAGFAQTVAPLGTALTEDQIKLLWRMAPEPILCFDGDAAGRKAAFRAVETVLPHLKPGFSLQFVFLPDGLDPDDLVRQHGAGAMHAILERKSRALFDVLIEREEQQGPPAVTPEQAAALEARLKRLVETITDADVKARYSPGAAPDAVGQEPQARQGPGARCRPSRAGLSRRGAATTPRSTGACASAPASAPVWAACRGRPLPWSKASSPAATSCRSMPLPCLRARSSWWPHSSITLGCWRATARTWPASRSPPGRCSGSRRPCSPSLPTASLLITPPCAPISAPAGLMSPLPRLTGRWHRPATSLRVRRQVPARRKRVGATPRHCTRCRWPCRWS